MAQVNRSVVCRGKVTVVLLLFDSVITTLVLFCT